MNNIDPDLTQELELPYRCPEDISLKFHTTLACDMKRAGDQNKNNNTIFSKRCESCKGPVLVNG